MDQALTKPWPMARQDHWISEVVVRERAQLRNFIRRRVADPRDAEDILQDVFYKLVEANQPVGGRATDAWRTGDDLVAFDYGRKGSTLSCHGLLTEGGAREGYLHGSNRVSHLRFA
jgi:hypothetical protein